MAKRTSKAAGRAVATVHDQKLFRDEGGELHQFAEDWQPVLTTAQGGPVADDQNSLRVGARGPALIEDSHLSEKLFHFDHERIPERVVHARGYDAHGFGAKYDPAKGRGWTAQVAQGWQEGTKSTRSTYQTNVPVLGSRSK